jgi:hypothetical protein
MLHVTCQTVIGNMLLCIYNANVSQNRAKAMKIKKKPIVSVRIREDRAQLLKEKAWELSLECGEQITESDLVNYLIDNMTESLIVRGDEISSKVD